MFENLSDRLERSFKILKGEGKITEINVAETLKDVRKALLDADVNYKVAKQFTDTVKAKALGMDVLTAVKPSQLMVKIVHDELALLMGGDSVDVNITGSPAVRVKRPFPVSWLNCLRENAERSLYWWLVMFIVLLQSNS